VSILQCISSSEIVVALETRPLGVCFCRGLKWQSKGCIFTELQDSCIKPWEEEDALFLCVTEVK
jgi:hypothetical protein